jgi:cytochrome c oxidase subunit III
MAASGLSHGFQYATASHQSQTAIGGMWLFLATEVLLFGGLILAWIYSRHFNSTGFDAGGRETVVAIGTVNTALLITSSFAYALGAAFLRAGSVRGLVRCLALAVVLAVAFLVLKFGFEYHDDFAKHLFPTDKPFGVAGEAASGAHLFFVFYFIGTGLHGIHMLVGVGLVLWIIRRARRGDFSADYGTPVEVVGLYWSFVDIVWLTLYPLIYLVGRG